MSGPGEKWRFDPPHAGRAQSSGNLMRQRVAPQHLAVFDPELIAEVASWRGEMLTEDEMAGRLGVEIHQFVHWRDSIDEFGGVVRANNTARRAYVERKAYDAALAEGDGPFMGEARLLVKILEAENPEKYAQRSVNYNKHEVSGPAGVSQLLAGLSSASIEDHFSRPDYGMPPAQAVQLVAEVFAALPEGYGAAMGQFLRLGLSEVPPSHLASEQIDFDDEELVIASATGQWMLGQGVSVSGVAQSSQGFVIDGAACVADVLKDEEDQGGYFG